MKTLGLILIDGRLTCCMLLLALVFIPSVSLFDFYINLTGLLFVAAFSQTLGYEVLESKGEK